MIEQILSIHGVATDKELHSFVSDIVQALNFDKRPGYNNELRYPDEQLKKI